MRLMKRIREAIKEDKFPEFVRRFMQNYYTNLNKENKRGKINNGGENEKEDGDTSKPSNETSNQFNIPDWVINSLKAVNIDVLDPI